MPLDDAERAQPRRGSAGRPRFDLDYLAVVDADTFVPRERTLGPRSLLIVAARLGSTRLIDNVHARLRHPSAYPAKDATA